MNAFVSLRPVTADDLPIFFDHQLDAEATRLAAFPSRDREAFFAHWTNHILGNPTAASHTILFGERLICYWLGRKFWGQGIATAAVLLLQQLEPTRPLFAHVVTHNLGSIRVLEKAGFTRVDEGANSAPDPDQVVEIMFRLSA